ncbi:hypothetical protein ETD86_36850 [Nonomuraea turkmeniaca]|uniref:TfoX/Sxy family protein n=1 Tax=Nonomuraea turkmeniaca TaxID=103838 RepID=A0A5S4FPL4_9ACTN|nr:hypothetical protein [Nonomuraea turkmeniaca]TMR11134.1 hypothetical protein ETD86_36850 [Nonomuraea turkmeniaca]
MADRQEAPNRDLLDLVAEDFTDDHDVFMGTMFRSPGLRVGGKIFAFLGHHGQLIVKLPKDRVGEFLDVGTAEEVVMGKRTMREWIAFPAQEDHEATLALWRSVAQEAHQYVDSLRQST